VETWLTKIDNLLKIKVLPVAHYKIAVNTQNIFCAVLSLNVYTLFNMQILLYEIFRFGSVL